VAAETQEKTRLITYRIESLQLQGFISLSWGIAAEDNASGVYIAGWKTIEVSYSTTLPSPLFFSHHRRANQPNKKHPPFFFKPNVFSLLFLFFLVFSFPFAISQDHMRLGTLDSHQVFVKEAEELFKNFRQLTVAHVHIKRHGS
jgi:hypothetical protein